ncbi:methionyl-tRNA formyltransferase [Coprobacter tertius]|uniref:Methionyl-tRNA formyltransferase n=1 Tax=Coprobacter tertius TaxID=2944915 RepID=A0ABT1MEG5_9BACT|nr:methionyl-tRNA formyltransferase [Coprobacter tertius]MCP9611020.1 methionyl-tRNA formyltransferase [Coprobacter tertius]
MAQPIDKKNLRIVYMGTPDFAVESLKHLVEGGYNVVGVITMPDKPAGRGHKIQFSPVKEYALSQGLPLLQPEKLKDENFITELRDWKADLQIVVAFRMLPEIVWNMPRLGTFNLHASLLPQYRGAAPINWAVINGEKETGATTFFLTHEIDTGRIILQQRIPILDEDNAGTVHDKLMIMGAQMVTKTVDYILSGNYDTIAQEEILPADILKPAPKIFKETCRIDWSQPIECIHNLVRGMSPYPAAWSELYLSEENPYLVKIYESEPIRKNHNLKMGTIVTDNRKYIDIACSDGFLRPKVLQLAGKKKMPTEDLLRGFTLTEKSYFK